MTQNLADELEAPKPGTPLPWQYRDDYTSEGFVTIIGNIDGEYVDGRPDCTYDVVCRCEDEFGERLPSVARNVLYIVHACNEYPALVRERDALKAENERLRERVRLFERAAYPVCTSINPRGYNWSEAYLDQALGEQP